MSAGYRDVGDWQQLINIGATAVLGVAGWFIKGTRDDLRTLERDLAAHRETVARDYAKNIDINRLDDKLDRILERLPPKP